MAEHVINSLDGSNGIYQPGLASVVAPGDTIVIPASLGPITYFSAGPLQGSPSQPIKIENRGGVVQMSREISLTDCQNVKVGGDGDSAFSEGFIINSGLPTSEWENGSGVNVDGYAKGIELYRLKIQNKGFGVWCKNEPGCDAGLNAHVIDGVNLHHCKILDIRIEGTYFGSTNVVSNGANVRVIDCGPGGPVQPPRLGNIKINDNLFDGTGRAAIQISDADVGMSEVLRNTVRNVGREFSDQQGNGINIGSFTKVRIQGNNVANTFAAGICFFGQYGEILDNVVQDSGRLDGQYRDWPSGIWIDTRRTDPQAQSFLYVIGNTIGRRGMGTGSNINTTTPDNGQDIDWADQYPGGGAGWAANNVYRGNISSVTGGAAKLRLAAGISTTAIGDPPNYSPGSGITSLFAVTPAVVVARVDSGFMEAGINENNTLIIYEVGNPLKSYVPGRSINAISGFTAGKGYYIVPKINFDITNLLIPPIPPGSLLTATKLKSITSKIMKTKI